MRVSSVILLAAAVAVTAASSYLAFVPVHGDAATPAALAAGAVVLLGIGAAAWARREDFLREWLVLRWGDFTRGLLGAVVLFAAAWAFARFAAPVGSPREIWLVSLYGHIGDPRELRAHAAGVAATIAVLALAEEVTWRGMVTELIARRVGSRTAWCWAAVLYALAYVPSALALGAAGAGPDPLLVLMALGGGLLWGAMARASGRLIPGIVSHALFDWAAVTMFPLWGAEHRL